MAGHSGMTEAVHGSVPPFGPAPWRFVEHPSRGAAAAALGAAAAADLAAALDRRARALFVAPGGRSPVPFLHDLAGRNLPWSRVDVLPGDERWVAADDARANEGLLRATLPLGGASGARLVSLLTAMNTVAAGAAAADVRLRETLGDAPVPDVAVLGMGTDMHTASLIPGAAGLEAALDPHGPRLVHALTPADGGPARLTLALPVLARARALYIFVTGAAKRAALETAAAAPDAAAPVAALARAAGRPPVVHWAP